MAEAKAKQSKSTVNYRLGGDACDFCTHYIAENEASETGSCELVVGSVASKMWCKLFSRGEPKAVQKAAKDLETEKAAARQVAQPYYPFTAGSPPTTRGGSG
jgi:hypothetical protein